jgi:hypothetical protein
VEHDTASTTDKRRSRGLSELEVEGLKDLLGETEDDVSVIEEEDEDSDASVQRV